MCEENIPLQKIFGVAHRGVVERIEGAIKEGWRLPAGIAEKFVPARSYLPSYKTYSDCCELFLENVVFPGHWNRLDKIKFFGDLYNGERNADGTRILS